MDIQFTTPDQQREGRPVAVRDKQYKSLWIKRIYVGDGSAKLVWNAPEQRYDLYKKLGSKPPEKSTFAKVSEYPLDHYLKEFIENNDCWCLMWDDDYGNSVEHKVIYVLPQTSGK